MFGLVENWELMNFFVFIGVLLFIAKILKEKLPFLNKVIIPTALIAGAIGLVLSDGFLNVVNLSEDHYVVNYDIATNVNLYDAHEAGYDYMVVTAEEAELMGAELNVQDITWTDLAPDQEVIVQTIPKRLSIITETVYHALAIGFIALTLRKDESKADKKVWSTGMVIVLTYLLQAVIGAAVVYFLFTNIFLGAGLLLPLGFGQGPGLATSIGEGYARGVGVLTQGAALGATIASIGFLVGGIIGVAALNYLARKHNLMVDKFHREEATIKQTFEFETIHEIRVFDALTMQIVIILIIYAFVYLTLVLLENYILPSMGSLGETFAGVFHGFNFLIGILYALLYRKILKHLEKKGKNVKFLTNNYMLSNISSLAFNFMIAAAVLTITIQSIQLYYLLVLVMAAIGSVITFFFLRWISHRIYKGEFEVHYFLAMFGMLTGTASTGLALLKGVDSDFKSPIAEEIVVGSGTAISMALPLFALLMFPGLAITSGNNIYNLLVFIIPITYGAILLGILLFINRKK